MTVVEDDIYRETMEPGAERAVTAELIELFPCPDERILREFLGAGAIADHACAERKDPPHVLPVEPFEGVPIAARGASDIVRRVSVYRFNHAWNSEGCSHRSLILFVSLVQMATEGERFEVSGDTFRR